MIEPRKIGLLNGGTRLSAIVQFLDSSWVFTASYLMLCTRLNVFGFQAIAESITIVLLTITCGFIFGIYSRIALVSWTLYIQILYLLITGIILICVLGLFVYLSAGWTNHHVTFGRILVFTSTIAFVVGGTITRYIIHYIIRSARVRDKWIIVVTDGVDDQEVKIVSENIDGLYDIVYLNSSNSNPRLEFKNITGVIVVGDNEIDKSSIQKLIELRLTGVPIFDSCQYFELLHGRVPIHSIRDAWFIWSPGFGLIHDRNNWRIKRLMDILFGVILLSITWPIILISIMIVKISSPGNVIFSQVRVGLRGMEFKMYKIRSMRQDAEKNGAQWANVNDPRITLFGRFMRTSRIDELPQLINILRGEMSFIGPRPERPEFIKTLEENIPYYKLRHIVKPGLTGWAQVNIPYGSTVDESRKKLEYELYYIKNYSLTLDIIIIVKTIRVVLFGIGSR